MNFRGTLYANFLCNANLKQKLHTEAQQSKAQHSPQIEQSAGSKDKI